MKIGIDARLIHETGVGRYIQNLIRELGEIDTKNEYVIFLRKEAYESFALPNNRWHKRLADVRWHSVAEQFVMPWILYREQLDLLHVPYFNVPLLYWKKFVVTIHDLTILHFDTGRASTLPYVLYKLRRLGYHMELAFAISWTKKILAVSQSTKKEVLANFDVRSADVEVTLEGVDKHLLSTSKSVRAIREPYFLYVGNAYPHKNVEYLIEAFDNLQKDCKLVLVGKDDYFYRRLKTLPMVKKLGDRIVFLGAQKDAELSALYKNAEAVVFPSLMEGFGLPALEAYALGCPVVVSDIPVFHELLGDLPVYVDPRSPVELTRAMEDTLVHSLKTAVFEKKAKELVSRFSWKSMAKETLEVYETSHRI